MMKRIFVLLFLSSLIVSCNKDGSSSTGTDCVSSTEAQEAGSTTGCTISDTDTVTPTPTPGSTPTPTPDPTPDPDPTTGDNSDDDGGLPTGAYTFDTDIDFINTTSTQQDKFDRAIEIIKKVVATEEFRSKVLNHTYNGAKTYVDNGGFTNAQIYQKILEGAETLQPTKNNTMNMQVELYYALTSTIGYTYPNTTKIWVNTKYFNTNAVTSVSANLFHEWLHKLGFKHASSYSVSRDSSVPYAIGRMISTLGQQYL